MLSYAGAVYVAQALGYAWLQMQTLAEHGLQLWLAHSLIS